MSTTPPLTRRRLLTNAAQLASAAAASMLMPPNVQKLMAQPPRRAGTLKDIKHVVLLMQENRSFDHYFGMLSGRSEEHTSELQSLMRISYAVFCLKKKKNKKHI